MVEVKWTRQAIGDVDSIAKYIATDSIKYAEIQVNRFFESAQILYNQPKAGRIVPEYNKVSLREIIIGNYRLVYKIVSAHRIDILTVHHSARILKLRVSK
ncbi:MAG: type II toxin-antitoxin system RelE/ParE family toxin [Bacteroidota bacterium]|jgi:addiction module RelE/StbE family toxin